MAEWRLNKPGSADQHEGDSDEDQHKRNKRRRRKPLPPLDFGSTPSLSQSVGGGGGPGGNASNGVSALHVSPHTSAFSVPKPRHHLVVVNSDPPSTAGRIGGNGGVSTSQVTAAHHSLLPRRSSPLPVSSVTPGHRTMTLCCCIQVQFERGRCSRTIVLLSVVMTLVILFAIYSLTLSYYSVDLFHSVNQDPGSMKKRASSSAGEVLSKMSHVFSYSAGESNDEPWVISYNLPDDLASRVSVDSFLPNLFQDSDKLKAEFKNAAQFVSSANAWSATHLGNEPDHVLYLYGRDLLNPLALFTQSRLRVLVLVDDSPIANVDAIQGCDSMCMKSSENLITQCALDLEQEGFITPETKKQMDLNILGVFPCLLASIQMANARLVHIEDPTREVDLNCLKMYVERSGGGDDSMLLVVYCGELDESNENQRLQLRNLLVPAQPFTLFMRSTSYALHPEVKPSLDRTSLVHFEALLLTLCSVVVQDDSGIPFRILHKHLPVMQTFGRYFGLGEPKLSALTKLPGSTVKSLYQPELSNTVNSQETLPFKYGFRSVIGPSPGKAKPAVGAPEVFVKRTEFKGSHLIVAKKR